ncbi:MAG: HAD family hydrolase [Candidatus Aenigmarchaeota archaeon]|nr:HAD family hydrolase [Candidatus Aenigmarchaeota archaeon]
MSLKVIVFDFWETLVAGNEKETMNKLCKKLNFVDVNSFWKFCDKEWFPTKLNRELFLKKIIKDKNLNVDILEIITLWKEATKVNKLFDDVISNLEKLSKKYNLVLLSNTSVEYSNEFIKNLGIMKFFDKVILSCDVELAKPNLKFFELILKETEARPNEICFIGDSYSNDIIPAEKIGFKTILIDRTDRYDKFIHHTIIKSLNELKL